MDTAKKLFTVVSRPTDQPATNEADHNFFGGITTSDGKSGTAIFSYVNQSTDSDNNTYVSQTYLTGPLTLKAMTLVPARTKPLTVALKTNGVNSGSYTFNALSSAITSGGVAFPLSLSGVSSGHAISGAGGLTKFSQQSTLALRENPAITGLANIGGAYVFGKNTVAIPSLTVGDPNPADDFAAWLYGFALANGYTEAGMFPAVAYNGGVKVAAAASADSTTASVGGCAGFNPNPEDVTISLGDGVTPWGSSIFSGSELILGTSSGDYSGSTLNYGGLISGDGTTSGTLNYMAGGTLVPSGSTNVLTASQLTWNAGGSLHFQLDNTTSGTIMTTGLNPSASTTLNLGTGALVNGGGSGQYVLDFGNTGTTSTTSGSNVYDLINFGATSSTGLTGNTNFTIDDFTILNLNGVGTLSFWYQPQPTP